MQEKKNILTYEGLRKYEDELHDLKVVKRQEVAQKIKEAREQETCLSTEYDERWGMSRETSKPVLKNWRRY